MKKTIKKYLYAKEYEIKKEQKELSILQIQVSNLEEEIIRIENKIKSSDYTVCSNVNDMLIMRSNIDFLLKKKEDNLKKIQELNKHIETIKERLKVLVGEKKALKKALEKIDKKLKKEETKKEQRIVDEIYNRNFVD